MRKLQKSIPIICLIGYLFFISHASFSSTKIDFDSNTSAQVKKNIAILPLENLSEDAAATKVITELLKKELMGKGWLSITKEGPVEEFLARRRIRYTGGITKLTAREIGKALGVDAVLVGSVNQFSETSDKVNVGLTARLVGTIDGNIVWADTLSYNGYDFMGFLGLGLITSSNILSSKVAKDIVKDISESIFVTHELNVSPFEIEKIEAFPGIIRGDDKLWIRVKVLTIIEEPKEIKVVIDNNEVGLTKSGSGGYEGQVTAPSTEGTFPVSIVARDKSGIVHMFDATGKIIVDNTPPKVDMTLSKKIFAPHKKGFVLFSPKLMSVDDIDEWVIEIFDKDGNKIRSDKGYRKLPKGLIWRGETDKRNIVEDGEYVYKFTIKDSAGNETVLTDNLKVKNNPPIIKVKGDKVEDKVLFTFEYNSGENIKSWKLSIFDKNGKQLQVMEGDGELPEKIEYFAEEGLDINRMSVNVTALDEVDNVFSQTKSMSSIISKKSPLLKSNGNGNGHGNGNGKGHLAEDF